MLSDARSLSDKNCLSAEVCIVGAGVAGISIATELAGAPFKVVLLESGGLHFEHRTQFLYRGENTGHLYLPIETSRRRQFGGTSAVWFGRCRPLDEIDFIKRLWVLYSGWPLSRGNLEPYYLHAHRLCQIDHDNYKILDDAMSGTGLESKLFYFSPPTHFGKTYLPLLKQADNINVFVHANVTRIDLNPEGTRVAGLQCLASNRKTFSVKAKIYILAAGGLENPRLLLLSRDVHSEGIGNQNDRVGRFFMEHPVVPSGAAITVPKDLPQSYLKLNYETFQRNIKPTESIGLPESLMKKEHLLNASAFLVKRPLYKTDDRFYSAQIRGFLHLIETLQHRVPPSFKMLHSLGSTIRNSGIIFGLSMKALQSKAQSRGSYSLHIQCETVPNPQSRVRLATTKDRLGMNQVSLQWNLSSQDLESLHHFEEHLYRGLQKRGFRTRKYNHSLDSDGWPVSMTGSKHHMGTTRMSEDPRDGVVDKNCRVYGVNNLYIAGSSVFPTSGMANPTLTIVALSVRLADHIKSILR